MSADRMASTGNDMLARAIGRPLGVLRAFSPTEVVHLKHEFPDFADIIDTARAGGVTLGGGPPDAEFVARTWAKALAAAERDFQERLPPMRARLARADQVELASEVFAAVSGSALLGLLVDTNGLWGLRVAVAIATLVGTLSALFARYMRRAPGGASLIESYISLLKLSAECGTLQIELSLWAASNGEPAGKGEELYGRASRVLTEMRTLLPSAYT